MLLYLAVLLALCLIVGAIYTVYGGPSDPAQLSAGETIPEARPPPSGSK